MNEAAWAMFKVTTAGVVVSLLTLFFVWRTVEHTRAAAKSARDANNIAREDRRAWVKVELVPSVLRTALTFTKEQVSISLQADATNLGASPAQDAIFSFSIVVFGAGWDHEKIRAEHENHKGAIGRHVVFPDHPVRSARLIIHRSISELAEIGKVLAGHLTFFVVAEVTYRVLGNDALHHSGVVYEFVGGPNRLPTNSGTMAVTLEKTDVLGSDWID